MKKNVFYFLLIISFTSHSQRDYYVIETDTLFCSNLTYRLTAQSYLANISYTDLNGEKKTIDGRKNLSNVSTFFINGITTDKIPQKVNKPHKYVKWAQRVVDGKLKVNYYHNEITTYGNFDVKRDGMITTGITKFFLKMPDGTFYDIRSSDRKKYIIPYLKTCAEFNSAFQGDFKDNFENFTKIIALYNSMCN
jgi:hypothetical protein